MVNPKKKTTLENIQQAAQELFLKHGFSATSLDDICRQAKVTKGGFFHYFKSKECLAKAVLKKFCSSSSDQMREAGCCESTSDPLDRVFAALDCFPGKYQRGLRQQGCLITTFIQELSQSHPEIQSMCVDGLNQWAAMLREDLKLAKKKYNPKSTVNMDSLANHCVAVLEGAQVLAKASGKPKALQDSVAHLKEYLKSVFNLTKSRRVS